LTDEDIRNLINEEFDKVFNRQITFNGKTIQLRDLGPKNLKEFNFQLFLRTTHNVRIGIIDEQTVTVHWPNFNYILNEEWVSDKQVDLRKIVSINTYYADEAVKRYGDKAKDGVIAVTTN